MKKLIFVCICALFTHALYANSPTAKADANMQSKGEQKTEQNTEQSKDKQALRTLLSKFDSFSANFTQVINDMQGQELQNSTGSIMLQKPQKLRWSVNTPEESLLLADGDTVYNVDPWVEQVTLLAQSELTQSNPLMLLISDDQAQWQQVLVNKTGNTFLLSSQDPKSSIVNLLLMFDEQGRLISLKSTDRQQQVNSVTFNQISYNPAIQASNFRFEVPENWIIDDQRSVQP